MSKEITLLTTQEANDQSYDQGRYPDFFPVNIGDDFKLETRPELAVMIPSPRHSLRPLQRGMGSNSK